jgi:hypothetical protein
MDAAAATAMKSRRERSFEVDIPIFLKILVRIIRLSVANRTHPVLIGGGDQVLGEEIKFWRSRSFSAERIIFLENMILSLLSIYSGQIIQ